ncbi:hypothetical protein [Rubrivirga marina]|uniref:Secreted protein n=1 Tax=Rubrivirga marina TaxID=1196024 RepID=A0A271IXG9_9BACT|nr:hypothetical protein [Rubrivirga marina]PAP75638.1 hypothetical protein BSZ37_03905 [Rubrivirga marina]
MRRLLVLVALDGLCALAAPLLAPAVLPAAEPGPPPTAAYVEVAGVCVEDQAGGAGLGGRPVEMSRCVGGVALGGRASPQ